MAACEWHTRRSPAGDGACAPLGNPRAHSQTLFLRGIARWPRATVRQLTQGVSRILPGCDGSFSSSCS
jgi:hypothetical protein